MATNDRIVDISVLLVPGMPTWPGDGDVQALPAQRIARGDDVNVTLLRHTSHTGTHLDAPWHFIDSGRRLDSILLGRLIGDCVVCDLTEIDHNVTASDLVAAGIPAGTSRLLLKTRNSKLWDDPRHAFHEGFIGIDPSGARWLIEHDVDLIGIDYLSVEAYAGDGETHRILLGAEVVIVEGLDLRHIDPGAYRLICLPLRLGDLDGAPCRVVLERGGASRNE